MSTITEIMIGLYGISNEETLLENAAEAVDNGFASMKMKIGRGHTEGTERIRAIREALSADMDLFVDVNCAFTVA